MTSSGCRQAPTWRSAWCRSCSGKARAQMLARSLEYEWHEDPTVDPFALKEVPKPTR